MKKYLLVLILAVFLVNYATAQQVRLERNVAEDTAAQNFGPNQRHFAHFFVGYGLVAGPAENAGSRVRYGASHELLGGYRYKFKVGKVYALGMETYLTQQTFRIKQHSGKLLPTPELHDEEKLKFLNLGLGFYNRFNWDHRGNYVGNFIDLGVYGNWLMHSAHIFRNDQKGGSATGASAIKTRETGLKYVKELHYGATARVGFNRYVFYGAYCLSNLFETYTYRQNDVTATFDLAELPRCVVGFQFSLHK